MYGSISVRIARLVLVMSLAAVATAIVAAEAVAKPAPHAAAIHLLPGGTLPAGWAFPVIIVALAVATLLVTFHAPRLRVVVAGRRRRRALSRARVAGVPSGNGSLSQAAHRPAA
jgi:hypothetical protein